MAKLTKNELLFIRLFRHSLFSFHTLAVSDAVVPSTSVETDERFDQLIVKHLEPRVTRYNDLRIVHHFQRTQLAVVRQRQLRTVDHCKKYS